MRAHFNWFAANELDVSSLFEALGLKDFCESYANVAMNMIREFYSNMINYKIYSIHKNGRERRYPCILD